MKAVVILFALVAAVAADVAPFYYGYAHPYYAPSSQYRAQDVFGQYSYGYATADGIRKSEARAADGSVVGGYSYTGADGKVVDIKYTAGADGFKAYGSPLPAAPQKPAGPDVPELPEANKKAIAEHQRAHEEAKVKAAVAPKAVYAHPFGYYAHPYNYNYGYPYTYGHPFNTAYSYAYAA